MLGTKVPVRGEGSKDRKSSKAKRKEENGAEKQEAVLEERKPSRGGAESTQCGKGDEKMNKRYKDLVREKREGERYGTRNSGS